MLSYERVGKRFFDILCSLGGLTLLSPFFIFISLLINIDSAGPVLFLQRRIGKGGKYFKLIKFRSMYTDQDLQKRCFTPGDKTRITRLGKVLRKTKIDELPELINVLKGDMSIVGPRPEVLSYFDFYINARFKKILSIRPGITDWASIRYRSEEELLAKAKNPDKLYREKILPEKLKLNMLYLQNIKLITDLKIIFLTLIKIFDP